MSPSALMGPPEAPDGRTEALGGLSGASDTCLRCGVGLGVDEDHDVADCHARRYAEGLAHGGRWATCTACRQLLFDPNRGPRRALHRRRDCDEYLRRLDAALDSPARPWLPMEAGF